VYRIRVRMLSRLSRIALSEFETVGAGRCDLALRHRSQRHRQLSRRVGLRPCGVAADAGRVAAVLFWMHWQLALFILLLNPVVILFSTKLGKRVKDLKKFENRASRYSRMPLAKPSMR